MKIQAVRGMQDILPAQKQIFREIEDVAREVLSGYGFEEVGLPLLEYTQLFKRLVGESTDIVEKEMYTFDDRNDESLTIRPEGTAGCARYAESNGLLFNQVQRFWYCGPMFRYERPQKGRYRQFEQIGAECFGMPGPDIDAELLLMNARLWRKLGISQDLKLEINSLGDSQARGQYISALLDYLSSYESELDEDSRRRLTTNPLRILDSKNEHTQEILTSAPKLESFLDNESKMHFENLLQLLSDSGLQYEVNPTMVRGLDYYNRTVFEWTTNKLGAQGTVCGGGRYDGLVEQMGGRSTEGVGFAMGLDRVALMLEDQQKSHTADIYVVSHGDAARACALRLAEQLRDADGRLTVQVHCGSGKFKAQMKKADASGAALAVIVGEDEVADGTVSVKSLLDTGEQVSVNQSDMVRHCLSKLAQREQAE